MMSTGIQNAFRGKVVLVPSNLFCHELSASRDNEVLDNEEQYISFKNKSSKKKSVMRRGVLFVPFLGRKQTARCCYIITISFLLKHFILARLARKSAKCFLTPLN